jgi:hypothetical protein
MPFLNTLHSIYDACAKETHSGIVLGNPLIHQLMDFCHKKLFGQWLLLEPQHHYGLDIFVRPDPLAPS